MDEDGLANAKPHRKHMMRHQKGFQCKIPRCPRKGGFGTINDLERHQASNIHKIKSTRRNRREFKCFGTNCTAKDKIWPRLDNFQQHLRRIHKDENTEGLVQQSNIWYDSVKQSELNGSGGQSSSTSTVQQTLVDPKSYRSNPLHETTQLSNHQPHTYEGTSMDNMTPRNSSHYSQGIQSDDRERHGGNTVNSMSVEAATEDLPGSSREDQGLPLNAGNRWDNIELQQNVKQISRHNDGDRPSSSLLPENQQGPYIDSFTEAVRGLFEAMGKDVPNLRSEQLRDGNGAGLCDAPDVGDSSSKLPDESGMGAYLEIIKNGSKQSRDRALREILKAGLDYLDSSQVDTEVSSPGNTDLASKDAPLQRREKKVFKCRHDGCTRSTGRMSEMKKHEKRHSRPYGCTQPGCYKGFGSKNDWKRHENTQHFQLQRWRCPVKTSPTSHVAIRDETLMEEPDRKDFPPGFLECAQVFDRKDKFQQHLQSEHSLGEKAAKHTVKRNEIGRNGQFQFWCGFCRKLIRLRKEGQDAWDERFDHIDNEHYKQNQTIETWVHLEGHFTKQCEEKGEKTGDVLETSDGLEVAEDVGEKSKSSDGGEEEEPKGNMKSAVPTTSATESILPPFAIPIRGHIPRSPAPGALSRATPGVARQVSLAPATKRKYASTTANSHPGNNTVAHHASSFYSSLMMPGRQQQILSQQTAAPERGGSGYSIPGNQFVPGNTYVDVNGLIPVDNTVPQRAIVSCVSITCRCSAKRLSPFPSSLFFPPRSSKIL
ncbi:hypothetical protein GX51_07925 [Blastomyces parvus]|uniref:C2H2-type domain-containing protein n=1 Tax=Blastomyces parvus TaxID=2060905 RepID=A0A2B7WIC4_9EURO|nr:hypothetical protein GX51_07925 [Blastomyces parvus]